ncbi:hypothetical protein A9Q99_08760 [Gammaproteobacteria bacterium 45_16_T64]|nr:hypothetical protein A9Q99_08760 [Gammaproteobacteria bacterium 45_16_T64]
MRRMSVNRPKEKVRGVERRLRVLDRWADSFKGCFPIEHSNQQYWNWKLPVLDRLVGPPTTNDDIQSHCTKALLRAAAYLSEAKPKECEGAVIAVLITYPQMFASEICVFFDREYFESFFKRDGEWQSVTPVDKLPLSNTLNFNIPSSFSETGYIHKTKDEWEGEVTLFEEEWWSYYEKIEDVQ